MADEIVGEKKYLFTDETGQDILAAEQARNTVLSQMLATLKNISVSADINAWKETVLALSTADKTDLASAIYEVLGLNSSAQKSVQALPDIYSILDENSNAENGAAIHNSLPRCKNLGTALTTAQEASVRDHTFKGLWAGDYIKKTITFDGITQENTALCTDFDYWLHCGDTDLTDGHILMTPGKVFFTARMNASDTTAGGYYNSEMVTTHLAKALNAFKALVGENHILTHKDLLTNATSNGYASGHAWYSRQIDLLNEPMVYGGYHAAAANTGTSTSSYAFRYTVGTQQLSLFRLCKSFSFIRANWYWLRDVVSSAWFAGVPAHGHSPHSSASSAAGGVRPFILYKAA